MSMILDFLGDLSSIYHLSDLSSRIIQTFIYFSSLACRVQALEHRFATESLQDTGRGQRLRQLFGGYRGQDIWAILRKLKSMDDGHGPLVGRWDPGICPFKDTEHHETWEFVNIIYLYVIFYWIHHDTYINYSCIWLSADELIST